MLKVCFNKLFTYLFTYLKQPVL